MEDLELELLIENAKKLDIENIKRHIFLCCDQTNSKCCRKEQGLASWEYLKKRLKELDLEKTHSILRSKANCLRLCAKGPIAVIYPEGIFYHSCTEEVLERIITEHLMNGKIVEEFCLSLKTLKK